MDGDEERSLRSELELVQQEIAELEPRVTELRQQIGERSDGPTDPEETAQLLTEVEQQEAVLALLKTRRDNVGERLRQTG
jgi:hypothetical protein